MKTSDVLKRYLEISSQAKFRGWPIVPGSMTKGPTIPFFGSTLNYKLETPKGEEEYTSIIRSFGWAVAFGVTKDGQVITLIQWKPGVNQASWELPPGGIGKLQEGTSIEQIAAKTEASFLKETGYGNGKWTLLGDVTIETGKYRGVGPDDHGLPAYLYLAEGLELIAEARNPEPNEIIETLMVPIDEFREVLASGLFTETSAVACAYKALEKLGLLKWGSPDLA